MNTLCFLTFDPNNRIKDAVVGFFIGIILIIVSLVFTFAVEKFAVKKWLVTGRAKRACVPDVDCASINRNLNCRVIHTKGRMTTDESAKDTDLNFSPDIKAVVLKRTVEILH